jgi:hypothetical protein
VPVGLYTCECPLNGHIGAPECDIGWHSTKDKCKYALREHLCGPTHDMDREEALRRATEESWVFQIDPLVQVRGVGETIDVTQPDSDVVEGNRRSRSPRRINERNAQMLAAARDAAGELAGVGQRINEVFSKRAAEFDALHTSAAASSRVDRP